MCSDHKSAPERKDEHLLSPNDLNKKKEMERPTRNMSRPKQKGVKRKNVREEEDDRKVQQRRAANRKSAMKSRQRRNDLIEKLKTEVEALSQSNIELRQIGVELKSKLELAMLENQLLRSDHQQQVVTNNVGGSTIASNLSILAQPGVTVSTQNNIWGSGTSSGASVRVMPSESSPFIESAVAQAATLQVPSQPVFELVNAVQRGNILANANPVAAGQELLSLVSYLTSNNEGAHTNRTTENIKP